MTLVYLAALEWGRGLRVVSLRKRETDLDCFCNGE